jgi:hypothetical protein
LLALKEDSPSDQEHRTMSTESMSGDSTSGDSKPEGLGSEGTIPNTEDGIAIGHDPDGSTFEPEEEVPVDGELDEVGGDDDDLVDADLVNDDLVNDDLFDADLADDDLDDDDPIGDDLDDDGDLEDHLLDDDE